MQEIPPRYRMSLDSLPVSQPLRLGVVGGGQLGKMIAEYATRIGVKVCILDPSEDCPASFLVSDLIKADFKDEKAIFELSKKSNVITFEIELANSKALEQLEEKGFQVHPSPKVLRIIQNKLRQKLFLQQHGIPVARFSAVHSMDDLEKRCSDFGLPAVLKACEDSYDGRGNYEIRSRRSIQKAFEYFSGRECMLEENIPFSKELSVMVARNKSNQIQSFPLVENIHEEGILQITKAPASVTTQIQNKARKIAQRVITALDGIGIFGIEMFVTPKGDVLVNEIAPRPHNSGHYSNEACTVSQFEQHVRAVFDLPLVKPEIMSPAVMLNILGPATFSGPYKVEGLTKSLSIPGARVYIYGKRTSSPRRKLGHITATGRSLNQAMERARAARMFLKILPSEEGLV